MGSFVGDWNYVENYDLTSWDFVEGSYINALLVPGNEYTSKCAVTIRSFRFGLLGQTQVEHKAETRRA